jgi:hypothetical protein
VTRSNCYQCVSKSRPGRSHVLTKYCESCQARPSCRQSAELPESRSRPIAEDLDLAAVAVDVAGQGVELLDQLGGSIPGPRAARPAPGIPTWASSSTSSGDPGQGVSAPREFTSSTPWPATSHLKSNTTVGRLPPAAVVIVIRSLLSSQLRNLEMLPTVESFPAQNAASAESAWAGDTPMSTPLL